MPAEPYRGIQPFRYADHTVFFAREEEARLLTSLVAVYRGVFLYGDSGNGKSSLINAGLLPEARQLGFEAVRVRVQPRAGEELVIEQIAITDEAGDMLPCVLAPHTADSQQVVLSIAQFQERVCAACPQHRPLLIFDQFEELVTLFDEADVSRGELVEMILGLLRDTQPIKLLFAFREDYLGKIKRLLDARPELIDQELRLGPPSADALQTIIRGPFERFPGRYARELDPALAQRLGAQLAERFGTGEISLSEVQTVCLRLWRSPDPHALLAAKSVQGLLEDDLGEALDSFPPEQRDAAIALLSHMITDAGTRNVISAEDLRQRVRDDDPDVPPALLDDALERLERDSKLVRRERRRDIYLYEITSEFLVPWISQRRQELRLTRERQRERRRLRILTSISGGLLIIAALIAALAIWALGQRSAAQHQRSEAQRQATQARSLALASSASALLNSRPDVSLLLAAEAYRILPRVEARSSALAALTAARDPGLRAILHGHTDVVFSAVFSPDGRTLASASDDNTVRLWDTRTHEQLGKPLSVQSDSVVSVAFSPDGRTLASAGADKTIRLSDVRTRKQLATFTGHTDTVFSVAFSPDGRTLASAGFDETIRLWDAHTHKPLGRPLTDHTNSVDSVAFSPDGRTLASASRDKTVRLWDVRSRKALGKPLTGHTREVLSVAFSPDGRTLASAGVDKTVRLWDVRSRKALGEPLTGHTNVVTSVAFSPNGRTLTSASADKTVRLWDVRSRRELGEPLTGHTSVVDSVVFSPDGRTLVSASDDNTIRLWTARPPNPLGIPLNGHTREVNSLAFVRYGRTLASASADKTVRLWDVRSHKALGKPLTGHTREVDSVALSPDGRTLASASADKTVRLWDVRSRKALGKPLTGHTREVRSVAFSPDGRTLASASADRTIRLWSVRTHKQLSKLTGHKSFVESVAFSPDGHTLASGSEDNTVRLWDVRRRTELGKPLAGHANLVSSVAFSPDGRTLASGSWDATVRLWDVPSRKPLGKSPISHTNMVSGVAFSPDGRTLGVAGADKAIRLWEKILWRNFAELQTEVCKLVGSGLSTTEWQQYAAGIPYRNTCT